MTVGTAPELRPLTMGRLLDQAIRLYRRNFLNFIGIIAIVQVPLMILQLVPSLLTILSIPSPGQFSDPTAFPDAFEFNSATYIIGLAGTFIVSIASFILIYGVASASLARNILARLTGESLGIIESYRQIGQSWGALLGALLLATIIFFGLLLWWIIVPCVGWLSGAGMLVFFGFVVFPLLAPIIVMERQSWSGAIRRAWDLARHRFWWVLGFVLILLIFTQVVVTGPVMLVTVATQLIFGGPLEASTTETILQTVIQSVVGLVFSLVYLPIQLTAMTLLYFDLRVRQEGLDLELLSATLTDEETPPTDVLAQAPRPERGNWITMNEFGYFILASLAGVALYFVLIFAIAVLVIAFIGAAGL